MFRERHIHLKRRIHLPHSLRSLRFRLFMMFLLMVLVTVGVVSWFTDHGTINAVKGYAMNKREATRNEAIGTLMSYNIAASNHPNQQAEQVMVVQIASTYNIRVVVVDPAGYVIASSDPSLRGRSIIPAKMGQETPTSKVPVATAPPLSCKVLAPNTIILSTNATLFCPSPLMAESRAAPTVSPEQSFLNSVNASMLFGILIAGLIALILAFAFSYTIIKPIQRMTAVARRMEEGDLSQRLNGKTHTEIGELAHALNTMADSLQRSEHLRRNMINDIAHELRTPLTNIRGYLEGLQDRVIDPEQEVIASLYEESTLLTRLVADLQELSLAEAGQLCLVRRPVALNKSILRAVHMLQLQAEQKQISLQADLPPDLLWVEADPERVAQLLRNLICNAITHTPEGGEITISAVKHEDEITVSVRDTGCGIEAQHLPYVFERFYRADSSRTRTTGGTGLGLAIVKQMVLAHGGRVSVESQPGCGSCFAFTLPAMALSLLLDYDLAEKC